MRSYTAVLVLLSVVNEIKLINTYGYGHPIQIFKKRYRVPYLGTSKTRPKVTTTCLTSPMLPDLMASLNNERET